MLVVMAPFDGLIPARSIDHARWATDRMAGRAGIALIVPDGFAAYARILHPLHDGSWDDLDPLYRNPAVADGDKYPWPHPEPLRSAEGVLCDEAVDALRVVLSDHTTTPEQCHYAVWGGWGQFTASPRFKTVDGVVEPIPYSGAEQAVHGFVAECAIHPWWGGRDMFLFDGRIDRVTNIASTSPFGDSRQSPPWWWPQDRAWFLGTEIDDPWTYLAGTPELIVDVTEQTDLEVVQCHADDSW